MTSAVQKKKNYYFDEKNWKSWKKTIELWKHPTWKWHWNWKQMFWIWLSTILKTNQWAIHILDRIPNQDSENRYTILEICFVAYSNPCNSLVFSSIFKNKVGFGKNFQFPVQCRKPHLSKSIRLEMAGDCVKSSKFETRKKSYLQCRTW